MMPERLSSLRMKTYCSDSYINLFYSNWKAGYFGDFEGLLLYTFFKFILRLHSWQHVCCFFMPLPRCLLWITADLYFFIFTAKGRNSRCTLRSVGDENTSLKYIKFLLGLKVLQLFKTDVFNEQKSIWYGSLSVPIYTLVFKNNL